jgi:hypothetical protein
MSVAISMDEKEIGKMVDTTRPTEQFHSYSAPDATPVSERSTNRWTDMVSRVGVTPEHLSTLKSKMSDLRVNETVTKAKGYAKANPGKVLGGLAALVIGIGLLRQRSLR